MKLHCAVKATSLWIIGVAIIIGAPPSCKAQSFTRLQSLTNADGREPYAGGSSQAPSMGTCTGTTWAGNHNGNDFTGTVFQITPSGAMTTLYYFCAQTNCADGADPYGGLVQGTDGNFYGTTQTGGRDVSCNGNTGCGTILGVT